MDGVIREDVSSIISDPLPWEKFNGATILVTGATGMVGQYIVWTLLGLAQKEKIKLKVLVVVRSKDKAKRIFKEHEGNVLQIVVQDVTEPFRINQKIDYVIHAASPASPRYFKNDPVGVIGANVLGSFNTLEVAKKFNAEYCFISTLEIYGKIESANKRDIYVREEDFGLMDSLDLRSAYPESKRLAENLCVSYGAQYGVDYKIARLTHTYGPGMDINDNRVQAEFIRQTLQSKDVVLKSDGTLRRTYTYVADSIAGIFWILLKDNGQRVYNVANELSEGVN